MIIEGDFYRITPINEHSLRFDLELLYEIGGKNPRKEFKVAAYGVSLEGAIKRAIMYATNKKLDNTVSLKQFLDVYKEESDKIRKELGDIAS